VGSVGNLLEAVLDVYVSSVFSSEPYQAVRSGFRMWVYGVRLDFCCL
jgi:hypothetical protein